MLQPREMKEFYLGITDKNMLFFHNLIWRLRVKKCRWQSKGNRGQFYSLIGYNMANGLLPNDVLERFNIIKE